MTNTTIGTIQALKDCLTNYDKSLPVAIFDSRNGYMSSPYTNSLFYPNDWQSTLKKNQDMRYLDLPPIQRYNIERIYKYREEVPTNISQAVGKTHQKN